jgi:hypothetical protein
MSECSSVTGGVVISDVERCGTRLGTLCVVGVARSEKRWSLALFDLGRKCQSSRSLTLLAGIGVFAEFNAGGEWPVARGQPGRRSMLA